MFKIINNEAPNYILTLIPKGQQTIATSNNHIPNYHCRTDFFKYFFPSTKCFHKKLRVLAIFKSRLLSFICPIQSNVYNIFDPIGLKLLTRLRLGCSKFQLNLNLNFCKFELPSPEGGI